MGIFTLPLISWNSSAFALSLEALTSPAGADTSKENTTNSARTMLAMLGAEGAVGTVGEDGKTHKNKKAKKREPVVALLCFVFRAFVHTIP